MAKVREDSNEQVRIDLAERSKNKKAGVDITWSNVKYSAVTKEYSRDILKGLSGICKQGEMTAIMGSSGAGKTTLLNILCCRAGNTETVTLSGDIKANGQAFDAQSFSNFAAYVMQEDIIMETMTVREALLFAGHMKIPGAEEIREAKVNEVLKIMRLEKCQHTLIGGPTVKGITKGEKKRTSIAFELMSDPDVIFLDEPTSGLDSFTAYNVVDVLQEYAKNWNKTIICTIHQPSSEIFMKFDRLILLVDGRFIYQGDRTEVIPHFASFGFACPHLSNPADYFMSIMHAESEVNRNNFKVYFENFDNKLKPKIEAECRQFSTDLIVHKSAQASFMVQLRHLTKRSFNNMRRNPILSQSRAIQAAILGLFTGIVYSGLPNPEESANDQRAVNDFNGALFFMCMINHWNAVLPIVLTIPTERPVFLKEENSKLYGVTSYFLSKLIVETILVIATPIIFSAIAYYMIGLNGNFGHFVFFLFVSVIQSFVGNAQGMFCGSLFKEAEAAINFTPLMLMPFMLFGGFYKNAADMPDWNAWLQWISNYRYTFEAYVRNNYEDSPFQIDAVGQLNLNTGKWNSVLLLVVLFLAFQALALILLQINKKRMQ